MLPPLFRRHLLPRCPFLLVERGLCEHQVLEPAEEVLAHANVTLVSKTLAPEVLHLVVGTRVLDDDNRVPTT